jgi:hypothetical protein
MIIYVDANQQKKSKCILREQAKLNVNIFLHPIPGGYVLEKVKRALNLYTGFEFLCLEYFILILNFI